MATSPFGPYADISRYQQAAVQPIASPLDALIQGFQGGQAIRNLPQTIANNALNEQLKLAIQQAELQKLQQPQVFNTTRGLAVADPRSPDGFRIVSGTSPIANPIETSAGMLERDASGKLVNVFPFQPKSPFTQQQVVSLTDPTDVRFSIPDASGQPPPGYQFAKAIPPEMKPTEKITAIKDLRQAHDETQSKLLFFGKGQVPGAYGIKKKLDAVLAPVNFDFSKLNPQAKQGFVFAANKLRDPTSATLLAEAAQIAEKAGIADRFKAFVAGYKEGDTLPDQVAKDIYQVISQTHDVLKADYLNDLPYFNDKTKSMGESLQSLGVPKSFIDEMGQNVAQPQGGAPSPVSNQNQEAINWLKANPTHPRAAELRIKLGL